MSNNTGSRLAVDIAVKYASSVGFRIWLIERCDRHLCYMTGNTRIRGWSALD